MNAGRNVSIISWRQLFVLVILCFGTFVVFTQIDQYVVTGHEIVNPSLLSFHVDNRIDSENILISDDAISIYSAQKDIVSVWYDIYVPPTAEYIKVSATIKTHDVDAGKNYWDGARVVFVKEDESGKFYYHEPHLVGAVSGNIENRKVSRLFNNEDKHMQRRLLLQLHNVRGVATFTNIEVQSMKISEYFIMMRVVVSIIWIVSIAFFFSSAVKNITWKNLVVWVLFIMIALGALFPGEVKAHLNQSVSSALCAFGFCDFYSIAKQYPYLIKLGFICETGAINIFKFGHLILFTMMSFFLMWIPDKVEWLKAVSFMLVIAVATETLQMMLITRSPSFHDLCIDMSGILTGVILAILLHQVGHKKYNRTVDV